MVSASMSKPLLRIRIIPSVSHCLRHVADRLRRGMPVDTLHRQADEGSQLMQAIARANRVYPGKDFGLIVDYNGMLKSLREAPGAVCPGRRRRRR